MAKRGRKPKSETNNLDVKQKVSQLLEGINVPTSKKDEKTVTTVDKTSQIEKEKNNKWLEIEFDRLTDENEKLRSELATVKDNYNKLVNQKPVQQSDSEVKNKIKIVFREIERKLWSNNPTIETKYVLNLMLKNFMSILKTK